MLNFKVSILSGLFCFTSLVMAIASKTNENAFTVNIEGRSYRLDKNHLLLTAEKNNSPYVFNEASEAFEAINKSLASNITLFVSPSVYWIDDPDDPEVRYPSSKNGSVPFGAEINCDTLSIIGLTNNPEDVVFAVNRGQTQGALGNYTMLHFKGKSLHTENITFGNYCNIDLVYPLDPSFNRQKRNEAIVQAQLGFCEGTDRLFARNCRFLSRLNLCPLVGARRSLYKDCYFECTDDALTGSAVYLDCKFTFYSGKPFYSTAKTGAVFLNCDIRSLVNGIQYLTKVPGMVTMIDTRFSSDYPMELQWTHDFSPIRSYQSNVTLNGRQVKIDEKRPELGSDITSSPILNAYKVEHNGRTIYNTPNLLGGQDGWDPLSMLPLIRQVEKETGKKLTSLPIALDILTSSRQLSPERDTLCLTLSPRLWGDYPSSLEFSNNVSWDYPSSVSLETKDNHAIAITSHHLPKEFEGIISASTPEGLTGATELKISPLLKDAPVFIATPSLALNNSVVNVNYSLSAEGNDESFITWYRSKFPEGADAIPVRHGYGKSASSYTLTSADHGYYISASVSPKLEDSHQGLPVSAFLISEINEEITGSSPEKDLTLSTSFAEIPIIRGTAGKPGFWNFDSYKPADTRDHNWEADENRSWYYGKGTDAATGIGLVQATRGARLSYTPTLAECKNMKISLVAEPCKGPGQGFGSATGQYMDICIKFDPVTLDGYALRIERTPDYDKAVTFTLMHYKNGEASPISDSIASNCFRNPCNISLEVNDDYISAFASTDATEIAVSNPEIKPFVNLTAPVKVPSSSPSFAIQHTGTVGGSATLIRDLNVEWE